MSQLFDIFYITANVGSSVGSDAGGVNIAGAGAGFDQGNASGTTKSAISSANVTITDDAKQLSLTGKTAQETVASINTDTTNANQKVDQIFDAAKVTGEVEATAQIMQSFTQYAPKAVADYASAKMNALKEQAKNETDPTKQEQLQEEAAKWDEGGAYRVAAHTIVGGLAGDIAGALGAGTSAATIPAIGDMINSADLPSKVKQTLVALAGTAIGAAAGASTGDGGALTGGATGYAQTVDNYLNTVKMPDGTYKVVGGKVDKDKNIYVVKSAEDQTRTGEVLGQMLFEDSFYFGDAPNDPKVTHRWRGIIDPKSTEGIDFLTNQIYTNTPSNFEYASSYLSKPYEYDFKTLGLIGGTREEKQDYTYRGSQISNGVYASARDYGNIGAGYVSGYNGLTWSEAQFAFERYQAYTNGNILGNGIETHQTVSGEKLGWQLGHDKFIKNTTIKLMPKIWNKE